VKILGAVVLAILAVGALLLVATSRPAGPQQVSPSPSLTVPVQWKGPDRAVSTYQSVPCGREVLRFGAQTYAPGISGRPNPGGISDLGYSLGKRHLWGDRGAPSTLYVTTDAGKTFYEWLAVADSC
jgi:hypothetical protein